LQQDLHIPARTVRGKRLQLYATKASVHGPSRAQSNGGRKMNPTKLMCVLALALTPLTPLRASGKDQVNRLDESATVFSGVMATPDQAIPQDLLEKAECIVIVPGVKKAAFIVGAKFGTGYLFCRRSGGAGWSAPGTIRMEGGSFGFQIGASETDVIMLVMNHGGRDHLLSSKFTLGGEAAVAAGPVGRSASAETDAQMSAEILTWSRSKGLFAGLSLAGATLRQDLDDNQALYGKRLENREIIKDGVRAPRAAARILGLLNQHSAGREHKADEN
jgi:lipid-binding SYLF domain-containing protein